MSVDEEDGWDLEEVREESCLIHQVSACLVMLAQDHSSTAKWKLINSQQLL